MKRNLLIVGMACMVAFSTLQSKAQVTAATTMRANATHVATDTVVNTGVKYQYTSYKATATPIVSLADLSIQFVITKISGTVGGSVVLQGSLDNVNFVNIGSAFTPTDVAAQSGSFLLPLHGYLYYRVSYTGTGTMSAKLVSNYIARKRT